MKFGISFLPDASPETKPAVEYFSDALLLARLADQGGLSRVKMTEHYLHPYGGYCPNPLTFLAAVAAQTESIRLMTGCILAAFHNPLKIASDTALVDALSGGRLDVGVGRGFLPFEFEAFAVPIDESRARFEATLSAIRRFWTEESVSIDSPFFTIREARSLPRPTQRPHPPLWGVAARARQSFAWLGENGLGLMGALTSQGPDVLREQIDIYRDASRTAGHGDGEVVILVSLYVAPDHGTAIREGDHYLEAYHRVWASAASAWEHMSSGAYPGYEGMARSIRSSTPAVMRKARAVAFGSPAAVAEYVQWVDEKLGVDEVLWNLDFGAMPGGLARRSLELFLEEVLPQVSADPVEQAAGLA